MDGGEGGRVQGGRVEGDGRREMEEMKGYGKGRGDGKGRKRWQR